MKKAKNYIKILLLVAIVLTTGYSVYTWQSTKPNRAPDMPILVEADKYANQVAQYDFKKARKYSTPGNTKTLENKIRPRMNAIASEYGLSMLKIKEVTFEKSFLVNSDPDYQIVAEKLVYDTVKVKNKSMYLRFDIKKVKKGYQISNTKLIEFTE